MTLLVNTKVCYWSLLSQCLFRTTCMRWVSPVQTCLSCKSLLADLQMAIAAAPPAWGASSLRRLTEIRKE